MRFLNDVERATFARDGVLFPVRALGADDVDTVRGRVEALGRARGGELPPALNLKAHLLVPALWNVVLDPRLVDAVESLLGPNILCWGSSFFDKAPGRMQRVTWHQDATYWGLDRPDGLTAWLALTTSSPANGCMRVIPESHFTPLPHEDSGDPNNMLPVGEKVAVDVDESKAVDVDLAPGEMSLHHPLLVHGSRPNLSDQRRCGFAIRYIAGDVVQSNGRRGSATLVRGRDFGGWDLEQEPEGEFHPAALRRHAGILRQAIRIVSAEHVAKTSQGDAR